MISSEVNERYKRDSQNYRWIHRSILVTYCSVFCEPQVIFGETQSWVQPHKVGFSQAIQFGDSGSFPKEDVVMGIVTKEWTRMGNFRLNITR